MCHIVQYVVKALPPMILYGTKTALSFTTVFPALLQSFSSLAHLKTDCPTRCSQFYHLFFLGRAPLRSRQTPPFSFTSFSRSLPLSARWAESIVRREEGRKKSLSVHHQCTNDEQPLTPPDTHVASIYRTTWLNMHLMGDLG